jgi:hypothetical protein
MTAACWAQVNFTVEYAEHSTCFFLLFPRRELFLKDQFPEAILSDCTGQLISAKVGRVDIHRSNTLGRLFGALALGTALSK